MNQILFTNNKLKKSLKEGQKTLLNRQIKLQLYWSSDKI